MTFSSSVQLLARADSVLAEAFNDSIRDSRMASYAEAFPDIAEKFSTLSGMTLQWMRLYLPPETEVGRKLKLRLSSSERAAAVAYGAAASAIADWEGRQARPPSQLLDAIDILLNRLWLRIGQAREAAPEPQQVIATLKDPGAFCVYCGESVVEAKERGNFEATWRTTTGSMLVGGCEHSFYTKDEWQWLSMGGERNRVQTYGQVCDLIAGYVRFDLSYDKRIFPFSKLPVDEGWDEVFAWLELGVLFGIEVDDDIVDTAKTFADVNLFFSDQLGISM